ncbi:sensor histidine kinase [Streptomyces sp. YKOK-I1]
MRWRMFRPYADETAVVDALMAFALGGVAVLLAHVSRAAQTWPEPDGRAHALIALAHVPVALRGRWPVVVFVVVQAAAVVYVSFGYWPVACVFGPMLALYTIAAHCSPRTGVVCGLCTVAVWGYGGWAGNSPSTAAVLTQAVLYCSVLLWFGTLTRRSAELARRLGEEQAERARRAVAEERGRIARELHDVVAHHMSVISVQAGLARFVFASDPDKARGALGTIADVTSEALEELRRMLKVLRDEGPDGLEGAPMPALAGLAELVERVRAGGVEAELVVEGTPRPLAPGVELCAYRIVQEALTNVIKHAGPAQARVELCYEHEELTVRVLDDGEGVTPGPRPAAGVGHGLIGMRERAKLYGGTISLGPRAGGGFAVELALPTSASTMRQGDQRRT